MIYDVRKKGNFSNLFLMGPSCLFAVENDTTDSSSKKHVVLLLIR